MREGGREGGKEGGRRETGRGRDRGRREGPNEGSLTFLIIPVSLNSLVLSTSHPVPSC